MHTEEIPGSEGCVVVLFMMLIMSLCLKDRFVSTHRQCDEVV